MTCNSAGSEVLDQLEAEGKLRKGSWRLGLMLLSGGLRPGSSWDILRENRGFRYQSWEKSGYSTHQNGDFSRGSNGITM